MEPSSANLLERLENYFNSHSQEQILADWEETAPFDQVIPNLFSHYTTIYYLCSKQPLDRVCLIDKTSTTMATAIKKTATAKAGEKKQTTPKRKSSGLCGSLKGEIIINGTWEDVFNLGR